MGADNTFGETNFNPDKKRVIFVGVHNKPGLPPLCSTTKTGKMIDRVIAGIDIECLKTNLFDIDFMPDDLEAAHQYMNWFERIRPEAGDIVITLGKKVRSWFEISEYAFKVIMKRHPAGIYSNIKMDAYVESLVNQINKEITMNEVIKFYKEYFGLKEDPNPEGTTINKSVFSFAQKYADHVLAVEKKKAEDAMSHIPICKFVSKCESGDIQECPTHTLRCPIHIPQS